MHFANFMAEADSGPPRMSYMDGFTAKRPLTATRRNGSDAVDCGTTVNQIRLGAAWSTAVNRFGFQEFQ